MRLTIYEQVERARGTAGWKGLVRAALRRVATSTWARMDGNLAKLK